MKNTYILSFILTLCALSSSHAEDLHDLEVNLQSIHKQYAKMYFALGIKNQDKKELALRWRKTPNCPTIVYLSKLISNKDSVDVSLFIDTNGDLNFNQPPDRTYQKKFLNVAQKTKTTFDLNLNAKTMSSFQTGVNKPSNNFNASIEFINFDKHVGKALGVKLVDLQSGEVKAESKVILNEPCQHFFLENMLESYHSYRLDIFADRDGNAKYDGLGKDRSWFIYFSQVGGDIKETFDFNDKNNAPFYDKRIEGF